MNLSFASNFLNHHQMPFCNAMYQALGKEFSMVSTIPMSSARVKMGWQNTDAAPFEIRAYTSEQARQKAQDIIDSSNVVILGSAPDTLMLPRLKQKKLTFKYAERFYKTGTPLRRLPRDAAAAWLHHGRFQRYPLYMLCASAYTAADAAQFGNYKNRCYKWGYFPETKHYDIPALLAKKEPTTILWVGRFLELKHPDHVLMVAFQLKNAGYNFRLDFIGTGPLEQKLRCLIAKLDLDDCVHMLGSMPPEDVRKHMEQAGIYLFTSDHNEGWGAVLNESMNSGCAVVASHAIGSVPFLLKDGENGLVYRSSDIDMLYEKTKYLLDHPEQQRNFGEAAYKTIAETWNAEVAAERFLQLSQAILDGDKHPNLFPDGPCSKAEIIGDDWFV